MEDFNALAEALSGSVGDARGALILSRDGLVLGAHPADAESQLKPAWLRFAGLGEPERGFLQFGIDIWSYVRRGPYAAFVVTGTSVRPGLVIDQIEMVLLSAEDARTKRDGLRTEPAAVPPTAAPSGKPRTPLHPETRPAEPPVVIHADVPQTASAQVAAAPDPTVGEIPPVPEPPPPGAAPQSVPTPPEQPVNAGSADGSQIPPPPGAEPPPASSGKAGGAGLWGAGDDEGDEEVDRFSLAREFSQLLQENSGGADG